MMKITLQVNGREMTFSEQELSSILEEHFSSNITKKATTAKVVLKPTKGECFEVKPQAINQKLFEEKRNDIRQERIRQLILEAFVEMKKNPEKYGKNFKTMIPKRIWSSDRSAAELQEMANNMGGHNADWVEQALEWAQRITNGESWETICNDKRTDDYRLVVWKNEKVWLVGKSVNFDKIYPASIVHVDLFHNGFYRFRRTVPLVVLYE